jgi:hypothetical protein
MRTSALVSTSFALVLAFAASAAPAQEARSTATPAAPGASAPMDCGTAMARHDHGAERNVPAAKAMPCAAEAAASGVAKSKVPAKPTHDHARFHKNL